MRRINDFSVAMTEVGMWAKVVIEYNRENLTGIVGRVNDYNLCFASNCERFDGCNEFTSEWDEIVSEYTYRWSIRVGDCGDCSIKRIVTPSGFDTCSSFTFVGIVNEQNQLVTPDNRINTEPHNRINTEPLTLIETQMSFINDKYTSDRIYNGVHSYHSHHGETHNKAKTATRGHRIGIELEIEFNSRDGRVMWHNKAKSNWFYSERDGSLSDYTGVEIITIPMNPKDIKNRETWEPLIDYLSGKAKSWDSPHCGLHVHVGREILGSNPEQQSETIGKLLYLYHHFVNGSSMNTKIFGRERAYNEKDGKTKEGDAVATLGSGVLKLKEVKDTLKKGMIDKSSTDRYFDINLQNTNTIEFRKGRGSIKASRIIMVIEYCEMLCKYAKQAKWEEMSREKFVDYIVDNVSKDSPLYRFFEAGERCDCSF